MDDSEKLPLYNDEKPKETTGKVSYSFEGQENFTLQVRKYFE